MEVEEKPEKHFNAPISSEDSKQFEQDVDGDGALLIPSGEK